MDVTFVLFFLCEYVAVFFLGWELWPHRLSQMDFGRGMKTTIVLSLTGGKTNKKKHKLHFFFGTSREPLRTAKGASIATITTVAVTTHLKFREHIDAVEQVNFFIGNFCGCFF